MGTLPIRACKGVKHRELASTVALVQERELRMKAEEPIERQRPIRASGRAKCELAPQPRIVCVAIRRDRRQAIDCTAQDDQHET
jgi:hypothetical protein